LVFKKPPFFSEKKLAKIAQNDHSSDPWRLCLTPVLVLLGCRALAQRSVLEVVDEEVGRADQGQQDMTGNK
jgi:hypothetical protein